MVDGGWRKSTESGQTACLEVARATDGKAVVLRDSKHPDGPRIRLTPKEWRAFVAGVRAGEFDDLCP